MNYDASKYRALGVGETILPGDFLVEVDGSLTALKPGDMIDQDTQVTVVRPIITRDTYETGAQRNQAAGKGRFDLVPFEGILYAARHYEYGVEQGYAPKNWEKGIPLSRFLSSMRRHSHQVGYCFQEQHVGAVLFNAMGFAATVERIKSGRLPKELDDIGYLAQEAAQGGAK